LKLLVSLVAGAVEHVSIARSFRVEADFSVFD
jgi:hypothetical protein